MKIDASKVSKIVAGIEGLGGADGVGHYNIGTGELTLMDTDAEGEKVDLKDYEAKIKKALKAKK